jgi:hypothetical protein
MREIPWLAGKLLDSQERPLFIELIIDSLHQKQEQYLKMDRFDGLTN